MSRNEIRSPAAATGHRAPWFAVSAVVAWLGLAIDLLITALGVYPDETTVTSRLGPGNADGAAGAIGRVLDFASYFTTWSNVVVAVVATVLALDARRDTSALRVLRLDSLMMITITGLVYAVVLAPEAHNRGWELVSNFFVHQLTPVLTLVVWLVVGPRGWIRWATIPAALLLPIAWLAWTLLRGAVIGAYPYPFLDVVDLGYRQVLVNVAAITAFGVVIGALLMGIDALLSRRRTS
jgi:hypothetical protein